MKKHKYLIIIFIIITLILIISLKFYGNKSNIKTETLVKQEDKIVVENIIGKTITEVNEEKKINNSKILKDKLVIINKKYDLIKEYISYEYDDLRNLDIEIKKLNESLKDISIDIALEDDIFNNTLNNLNSVSDSLNQLIELFGTAKEEQKILIGDIKELNEFVTLKYDNKEYKVSLNESTEYDGNIDIGSNVIIICNEPIKNEKLTAKYVILK